MLEHVTSPSTSFDQPNNEYWDEFTKVCILNVKIDQDLVKENSEIYALNNPGTLLPYAEMKIAIFSGAFFEIVGVNGNGKSCSS